MDSLLDLDQLLEYENLELKAAIELVYYLDGVWYWREWTSEERRQYDAAYEIIEKFNQRTKHE